MLYRIIRHNALSYAAGERKWQIQHDCAQYPTTLLPQSVVEAPKLPYWAMAYVIIIRQIPEEILKIENLTKPIQQSRKGAFALHFYHLC